MLLQIIALGTVLAAATYFAVDKIKKWAAAGTTNLQIWLAKWFVGTKVEIATFVIGALSGILVKVVIMLGGISLLLQWGIDLTPYQNIALWGYVVAGAISGFLSAIGVKFIHEATPTK
jgi:hypothetical protein